FSTTIASFVVIAFAVFATEAAPVELAKRCTCVRPSCSKKATLQNYNYCMTSASRAYTECRANCG
ncbi:hypothetical protein BGZ46_005800, partial [Entomortierella lignicola]